MRIGLVCPYSLDAPGGVQNHVKDLAGVLVERGHDVAVLAPGEDDPDLPAYVTTTGRAVPVPYNGSVARLAFGPVQAARVRRWLKDVDPEVLHVHEPTTPSVSMIATAATSAPVVATFHTAQTRSRTMSASSGLLRPVLEKVTARIAVSEYARATLVQHLGGEPVIIPNGVHVATYAAATARPEWAGDPTISFVGRLDEPRKGLDVLLQAMPTLLDTHPGLRLLVVGGGDAEEMLHEVARARRERVREACTFLGFVSDTEKADALATSQVYVAPHRGGESFGIVLVEAMAAGAAVVASDLAAFSRVLDGGRFGRLFTTGDVAACAEAVAAVLDDDSARRAYVEAAREGVRRYDWEQVASQVERVYETVTVR
ncbi:glycosyltransferase family 4 protein [Nocardioidaceae bacterium]|nr:glycosyltransferase family 4 protein [Nocardioidaceae bacterium]